MSPTIRQVRALVARGGGGDYHDQGDGHWIDDHIASPMSRYPEYRASRQSFGINVLGTLVVEVEASDGTVGFALTTGGEPAAYIVEKHLARFLEGRDPKDYELIWDQMYSRLSTTAAKDWSSTPSPASISLSGISSARSAASPYIICSAGRFAPSSHFTRPVRAPTWLRSWVS